MDKFQPLSPKAIAEFRSLYREEFGEDISDEEAGEAGLNLLAVLKQILESPSIFASKTSIHKRPD